MVELRRAAGLHDGDVVHDGRQMRQHLGELRPALSMLREFEARPQNRRIRPDEGITLPADHRRRQRLAFILRQHRLVIEHLELRRRTGHEHVNHRLRLRLKMRGRSHIRALRGSKRRFRQQRSQRDLARADGAILEEMSAGEVGGVHAGKEPFYEQSSALLSVILSWAKLLNCM